MYIVNSYFIAVILSTVTMLCWGSWANTQKMISGKWPFQLFYRDYVIGVFLFSLLWAFTIGSIGDQGQSFVENLSQAGWNALLMAFLGGVVFNFANILLVAAIDIAGLAVAFPVAIGISCSQGTVINYIVQPEDTNPVFLFVGVTFFLLAVLINSLAYKKIQDKKQKASSKGILISILSGVFMGTFYYAVASSISPILEQTDPGKLTPYSAVVVFSFGVLVSDFLWNSNLMAKFKLWNRVNYSDYFKGKKTWHIMGIAGGVIWSIGMCMSIISAGKAGYAIAFGLGNGATLIAALWGVFVWKEFKGASKTTNGYLVSMFLFFTAAIILIIISKT